jgi:antitoxin component YwqK of YwqJK toxin-antitoxin module
MNIKLLFISYVCLLLLTNCNTKNDYFEIKDEQIIDSIDMVVFTRKNDAINTFQMDFDKNDNLNLFEIRCDEDTSELLSFYSSGNIRSKHLISAKTRKKLGKGYFFYESGLVESERNYENDLKVGYGYDYYDTTGNIKAILLFCKKGCLHYRRTLDQNRNTIKVEGKR